MHLVTRGHFWSCAKDGGHIIWSAIAENPMLHTNLMALCFIDQSYGQSKFYIAGIGIFDLFCSCYLGLHMQTWPIIPRGISDVQIWTSYIKAFKSYCLTDSQTDMTKIIYHAALWVVNKVPSHIWHQSMVVSFHAQPDICVRSNYSITRFWPPSPVVVHAELIDDREISMFHLFAQMVNCIVQQMLMLSDTDEVIPTYQTCW